ncbi:MAG: hypothetical protein NBV57_01275 [Algoriphagus sp.]|nr:hypothetical protein [Algoriphagus sp.]
MKNSFPFSMKSRIAFAFSLLILFAGVYFWGSQVLTEEQAENHSNPTSVSWSQDAPVNFVGQGDESPTSGTDLVAAYTQLYGKYQVKVYANRKFSKPTDQEIEALHLEAEALHKLYSQMTLEERTQIKRASFPFVKLEVAGKMIYKKAEDLTPEERKNLNC